MATSDALYVVEDWISEHYFTSDDKSGTFAARAKLLLEETEGHRGRGPDWRSPRDRFTSARTDLVSRLVDLQADAASLSGSTGSAGRRDLSVSHPSERRHAPHPARVRPSEQTVHRSRTLGRGPHGPLRRFSTRGVDEAPLAMLDALAADDVAGRPHQERRPSPRRRDPRRGYRPTSSTLTTVPRCSQHSPWTATPPSSCSYSPAASRSSPPRSLWPQGRYLVADLQTIAERTISSAAARWRGYSPP